jgi:hypothetical protein
VQWREKREPVRPNHWFERTRFRGPLTAALGARQPTMAGLRSPLLLLAATAATATASSLLGRITSDVYVSPRALFQVNVPRMENPFVKKPQSIRDERTPDGGEEVTFSVLDFGEAWRYGVIPAPSGANVEPSKTKE